MAIKETIAGNKFIIEMQDKHPGSRYFRNNTGAAWMGKAVRTPTRGVMKIVGARLVRFGVGLIRKNRQGKLQPQGGGDHIGWTRKYCCELFGKCPRGWGSNYTVKMCIDADICTNFTAVFTSIEVKTGKQKQSPVQEDFAKLVVDSGGLAFLARDKD